MLVQSRMVHRGAAAADVGNVEEQHFRVAAQSEVGRGAPELVGIGAVAHRDQDATEDGLLRDQSAPPPPRAD